MLIFFVLVSFSLVGTLEEYLEFCCVDITSAAVFNGAQINLVSFSFSFMLISFFFSYVSFLSVFFFSHCRSQDNALGV